MTKLTTAERLATVEERTVSIEKKVDNLDTKFDNLIEKLDTKYASKWVESAVGAFIGFIVLAVVGALLALILNR